MGIIDLIPGGRTVQLIVLGVIAAALIGAVTWGVHTYNESLRAEGRAEIQTKWDKAREVQKDQALAEAEANAKETQRRLARQGDAQREHDQELSAYQSAVAAADAAGDGLRKRIATLAAAARRGASDTATVADRQAAGTATGMLADLSGRTDAAADLYARVADARRRAGLQCERDYDALSALRR